MHSSSPVPVFIWVLALFLLSSCSTSDEFTIQSDPAKPLAVRASISQSTESFDRPSRPVPVIDKFEDLEGTFEVVRSDGQKDCFYGSDFHVEYFPESGLLKVYYMTVPEEDSETPLKALKGFKDPIAWSF